MNIGELNSRDAVIAAITECDALGRDQFLQKYGYGPARSYLLSYNGKQYDSKAIAGVAYGIQFPDRGPLKATALSGGDATVSPVFERLGFQITSNKKIISSVDLELIRTSRSGFIYRDLSPETKAAYKRVHEALGELGRIVVEELQSRGQFDLTLTSQFTPDSGTHGYVPKDIWFAVSNTLNEEKFVGMPQLFMIVSDRGIEYGFTPVIHPSDFTIQTIKDRVREAAPKIYATLPPIGTPLISELDARLSQSPGWFFRKKIRLEPGINDYPGLASWVSFFKSPTDVKIPAGSISRYVGQKELDSANTDLVASMKEMTTIFGPLMEHMTPNANTKEHITPDVNAKANIIQPALEELLQKLPTVQRTTPFGHQNELGALMKTISTALGSLQAVTDHPHVKVSWSLGAGNWAKVPWIGFTDDRETDSIQRGIYGVFLFADDMSGVYLTLNQGVTAVIDENGRPRGRRLLRERADECGKRVPELREHGFLIDAKIDLKTEGALGTDYEHSTIAYKFYQAGRIPSDDDIQRDLAALLDAYERVITKKAPGRRSWIFQTNPDLYDIDGALKELKELDWLVQQHGSEIHTGDEAYIWRSGLHGGVIATATVLTEPAVYEAEIDRFTVDREKFSGPHTWVRLRITETIEPAVTRQQILENSRLKDLSIIKFSQGTNFRVSSDEAEALRGMIANRSLEKPPLPETTVYTIDQALDDLFLSRQEISHIDRVWEAKKNLILQGPPGVGKTYVATRLAYLRLKAKDNRRCPMIQFHQSYSYEDFIQGYRPTGDGFVLKNGVFYDFCLRARSDLSNLYVFIIDEINRGNLSKIFGELMMLIESDKRGQEFSIPLTYSKTAEDQFYVPPNVYLLGLMNTADRSLAMVDYALRRRFGFITLEPKFNSDPFQTYLGKRGVPADLIGKIVSRMSALNEDIAKDTTNLGRGYRVGHSFFCPTGPLVSDPNIWYRVVVETEVLPLLEEYWTDDVGLEKVAYWRDRLLADI